MGCIVRQENPVLEGELVGATLVHAIIRKPLHLGDFHLYWTANIIQKSLEVFKGWSLV